MAQAQRKTSGRPTPPAKIVTMPDRRRREDRQVETPAPVPAPKKVATEASALTQLGIVPEWSQYKELKELGFSRLCEDRQKLDDEIKFRETKKKLLDEQIEAALALAGTEKVNWEDRAIQIVHKSGSAKLVPEKLLEAGVPASTIAACTVVGNGYSYLLFGKPKKET